MYENYKLCGWLTANEICVVVEQYKEGTFFRKFHAHVPKSRLSDESRRALLRALVIHFEEISPWTIIRCHLNGRGRTPSADGRLAMTVSYPEPGALRCYCGLNTKAWSDRIISKADFRTGSGEHVPQHGMPPEPY